MGSGNSKTTSFLGFLNTCTMQSYEHSKVELGWLTRREPAVSTKEEATPCPRQYDEGINEIGNFYSYHPWCGVHSLALTRTRRAYFDVANVLETYQPMARTTGHLFQPEPPTPGNVKFAEGTATDNDASKHSEFNNARDSHYANMFEHAVKMAKEMEVMEKAAASPSLDAGQTGDLVAADPSKDKKEHEEKKKKEHDEYKKGLEKPFSC